MDTGRSSLKAAPTHAMELPRKILIGDAVISQLGSFIIDLKNDASKVSIISGMVVKSRAGPSCKSSLMNVNLDCTWHNATDASMDSVNRLEKSLEASDPDFIVGLGGGRSVDLAKMVAFRLQKPFLSVPTSASHDGISSPFVSVRGSDKPYSIKANTPIGVLADTHLLSEAPPRLLASGCGDLVAKITAVKDWELAREDKDEYFGTYAANLAFMSAKIILNESKNLKKNEFGVRTIVEALISSGVAACIAGSSRPCSGSEHLFSHALEYVASSNCGLHGERVGIGTIMMAKLHGIDWEKIANTLEIVGAPTKARQINVSEHDVVKALLLAQSLRPDRYTILSKIKLTRKSATDLAKSVNVL